MGFTHKIKSDMEIWVNFPTLISTNGMSSRLDLVMTNFPTNVINESPVPLLPQLVYLMTRL